MRSGYKQDRRADAGSFRLPLALLSYAGDRAVVGVQRRVALPKSPTELPPEGRLWLAPQRLAISHWIESVETNLSIFINSHRAR
jgi:hypothetical protein